MTGIPSTRVTRHCVATITILGVAVTNHWRYVALVVVLWCPALSSSAYNRSQMKTSKCTCLIFGISISLFLARNAQKEFLIGQSRTRHIADHLWVASSLSVSDLISRVIAKCAQSIYAFKKLRCHGMGHDALTVIYKAVVIEKFSHMVAFHYSIR